MPSRIAEKPKGSGNWYLTYRTPHGEEGTVPLLPFGAMTDEKYATLQRIVTVLKAEPRRPRGRPKAAGGDRSRIPGIPEDLRVLTPEATCEGCLEELEQAVLDGDFAEGTWDARKYQYPILCEKLGAKSWVGWLKGYGKHVSDMPANTRSSYDAGIGVLVRHGAAHGIYVPDVRKESPRKHETPTLKKKRRRKNGAAPKRPYELPEVHRLLAVSDASAEYPLMKFFVPVCARMGLTPVDAHTLLKGDFPRGEGFLWDSRDGVVWYGFHRVKSDESPQGGIPVQRAVADLLRPYRVGEHGLDLGIPHMAWQYKGLYPRLREQYIEIQSAAEIAPVKKHTFKRLRHTFQACLENRVRIGDPPGSVPLPVRKRLMGQSFDGTGDDIIAAYGYAEDDLCVQAVEAYGALIDEAC